MGKPWSANGGPDPAELRRLIFEEKLTDREIGALYGVTASAAQQWREKIGIKRSTATRVDHRATGAIPWELDASLGHHHDPIARLLRYRNRLKHGEPVAENICRRIKEMEDALAAEGVVIDYDPAAGFITRARDPQLDRPEDIVRQPRP